MDVIKKIWPLVESVGVPILAIIGGLSFFSLNFYWRACSKLRYLEKYLLIHKTIKGFRERFISMVGLFDIIYGFRPLSKFDKEFFKYSLFSELFRTIVYFRNFYKVVFPVLIILSILGITINECLIDK